MEVWRKAHAAISQGSCEAPTGPWGMLWRIEGHFRVYFSDFCWLDFCCDDDGNTCRDWAEGLSASARRGERSGRSNTGSCSRSDYTRSNYTRSNYTRGDGPDCSCSSCSSDSIGCTGPAQGPCRKSQREAEKGSLFGPDRDRDASSVANAGRERQAGARP
jgi:hypothetical protein